jgi:hypothetical protein
MIRWRASSKPKWAKRRQVHAQDRLHDRHADSYQEERQSRHRNAAESRSELDNRPFHDEILRIGLIASPFRQIMRLCD